MVRLLAFAKYLPAVLCGLLVVAWVASLFADFGVMFPCIGKNIWLRCYDGGLDYTHLKFDGAPTHPSLFFQWHADSGLRRLRGPARILLGAIHWPIKEYLGLGSGYFNIEFPIPAFLTLLHRLPEQLPLPALVLVRLDGTNCCRVSLLPAID